MSLERSFRTPSVAAGAAQSRVAQFRVFHWNVLADGLAQHGDFVKTPAELLEWGYREPLIVQEIAAVNADLIGLHEMNHVSEGEGIPAYMAHHGFVGFNIAKDPSPCTGMGFPADGSALYAREERFRVVSHRLLELTNPDGSAASQRAVGVLVQETHTGAHICFVAAHLKAKKSEENDRVRKHQAAEVVHVAREMAGTVGPECAVIVAGDFNGPPTSPLYETMVESGFVSAYNTSADKRDPAGEPPYTTWKFRPTESPKHVIDYIWYDPTHLVVERCLSLPTEDEIGEGGLPSALYPSDHLSLGADFLMHVK